MTEIIAIQTDNQRGSISDQCFLFSSEFHIVIKVHKEVISIEIAHNSNYVKDFFGEHINNICAIIGQNGVGKTTTLRLIKEMFLKDRLSTEQQQNDILILKLEDKLYYYINSKNRNKVEIFNSTNYEFLPMYYKQSPKLYDVMKDFSMVFYSNSSEEERREIETTNLYNISTTFLRDNIGKINRKIKNKKIRNQSSNKRFRITELKRQIDFLNHVRESHIQIDIPFKSISKLSLEIAKPRSSDYDSIKQLINKIKSNGFDKNALIRIQKKFLMEVDNLKNFFTYERSHKQNIASNLHFILYEAFTLYVLKTYFNKINADFILYSSETFEIIINNLINIRIDERSIENSIRKFPDLISSSITEVDINAFKELKSYKSNIKDSSELLSRFFDLLIRCDIGNQNASLNPFNDEFTFFLNFYLLKSEADFNFVSIKWLELSAGELSLLSFFSRFHSISRDIKSNNVLVLIDEGDLYFHPEWQRDYIYFLLEFLEKEKSEQRNISIIMTTHSPFVLSDLPKENLILLRKDVEYENKTVLTQNSTEFEDTFGGNIHTLFSQAFFMGETTVSKFARKKIQHEVIDKIGLHIHSIDLTKIFKIVDKIGEPVLKEILTENLIKSYGKI